MKQKKMMMMLMMVELTAVIFKHQNAFSSLKILVIVAANLHCRCNSNRFIGLVADL